MPTELSQLISALVDPDPAKRCAAAERLAQLAPDARAAAVPLVRVCADDAEEVREWAAAALEELGPPRREDVDPLSGLLGDKSPDVGYAAGPRASFAGFMSNSPAEAVAYPSANAASGLLAGH